MLGLPDFALSGSFPHRQSPGAAVVAAAAPPIGGKPFTVSCVLDTTQADAVILSHGGLALGYALHLREGRVVFSVRSSREPVTEITASKPLVGPTRITASLGMGGMMTLQVEGQPAVTGKAAGLIARQPAEDFCLGHDSQYPVTLYTGKEPLRDFVTRLQVTSP